MNNWDKLNCIIEQSNIKRYNWKQIFGVSLTDLITQYKKKGFSAERTYISINDNLCAMGYNDYKMFENVKISTFARFCEQSSYTKRSK